MGDYREDPGGIFTIDFKQCSHILVARDSHSAQSNGRFSLFNLAANGRVFPNAFQACKRQTAFLGSWQIHFSQGEKSVAAVIIRQKIQGVTANGRLGFVAFVKSKLEPIVKSLAVAKAAGDG